MRRTNAYVLRNLGLSKKLAASIGLSSGLLLFLSGWVISVVAVNWGFSWMTVVDWGIRLAMLHSDLRWLLFVAHVLSLGLLLPLSMLLVQRMPLPRLTRRALFVVAMLLAGLDLSAWLLLPFFAFAQAMLGAIVLAQTGLLGYLVGAPLRAMWQSRNWREPDRPVRVVVVGGGFAGLDSALGLDRVLGWSDKLELTLIDRKNYFLFPPLLPSVSVGAIETRQVTYPFRRIFEATNIVFKKETVERIDLERKLIISKVDIAADAEGGALRVRHDETPFDYLVLAPGSTTQTFNTPGCEHAFFMRELEDAIALRNHIIDCLETAARESNRELVREMLCFVVIGAGPTGVEVASEVRDLIDKVLLPRYPEIEPAAIDVVLIDTGERVLPGWNPAVATSAEQQLSRLGVRVLHQARVAEISTDWVKLKDGTILRARTACWCAGVAAAPLMARTGLPLDRAGRVTVEADCRVAGHPNVFVLGDAATFPGKDGRPLPPLGQVAFQQGARTAKNLVRLLRGQATRPFEYFDFGQLVSVGHQFAAVRLLGVRLSGFLAWFVWRTLYLGKLVGFGNKIRVMLDWTLDLFVERSSSQIHATRAKLEAAAVHEDHELKHEPAHEPARESDAPRAFPRAVDVAARAAGS
ncbi:MAG TPA: NAD(P)/FAD-dependent oxidoreductase [Polyangiaceae bacterium]|nr:NAD(P)/FAD-dependent oxidoreductase [Polyangiaceae bacterium]